MADTVGNPGSPDTIIGGNGRDWLEGGDEWVLVNDRWQDGPGDLILGNADDDTIIVAAGTSCRHQIEDGTGKQALHPAQVLRQAIDFDSER